MKIYTKSGDDGTTGLIGGERTGKESSRIAAYGTVDELNATLGVARAALDGGAVDAALARVQDDLFVLGAELASPPGRAADKLGVGRLGEDDVKRLEQEIDDWEAELPPLKNFIVPGGAPAAAALHLARTICRRAERTAWALARDSGVGDATLRYLNRLSDHLFVAARTANRDSGVADVVWRPRD